MATATSRTSPAQAKVVAVIDIGSNSVRMVISQVHPDGTIETIERTQKPVRLGHSTFVSGRLDPATVDAAIAVLRDYRRLLDTYHVEHVRAVSTSAVREAANRDAFLDRVSLATDLDVEVLEQAEESRLTVSAVQSALGDLLSRMHDLSAIVEVGGGSALLAILRNDEVVASEAYHLGSIRLQEILGTWQEPPERAADILRQHIENQVAIIRRTLPLASVKTFVAVGGDARFAAHEVGKDIGNGCTRIDLPVFDAFVGRAIRHTPEDMARKHSLSFANAETLVPALLAYQALLHATGADSMIVMNTSLRDGLLLDVARQVTGQEDPRLAQSTIQSAELIGEKYRYDTKHAHHVADLAVRLFDEMKTEHRLPARARLLLHAAAILHEIGDFVSPQAHHKHSYYLISNAAVFGLQRDELRIVAHVARYHRRSMPKPFHLDYAALPRDRRMVVNKLAALLRVADALDRAHTQHIRDFTVERRRGEIVLYVKGVVDFAIERRALANKADLFEDMYGMKVRVEEDSAVDGQTRRAAPVE